MNNEPIRVFCPTHEASFEVVRSAKIICEITGHSLSVGFPVAETWEFCANCETFTPSRLGKGEKARDICLCCQNKINDRSVCLSCGTLNFGCDSHARGKKYKVTPAGMAPQCAACTETPAATDLILHKCKEIEADLYVGTQICPFCLDDVTSSVTSNKSAGDLSTYRTCPACATPRRPGSSFCPQCRYKFDSRSFAGTPGSDISLTPVMGNLCPNCSTPVPSGSSFCGECGQTIVALIPPPPPPPSRPPANVDSRSTPDDAKSPITFSSTPPGFLTPGKVFGGLGMLFFVLVVSVSIYKATRLPGDTSTGNSNVAIPSLNRATPVITDTSLRNEFARDYEGTIGSRFFTISLQRNGRSISGTASTGKKTDNLSGTIESNGEFEADGEEAGGDIVTGKYSGKIENSGRITGYWTYPDGSKPIRFDVTQRLQQ